MRSRPLARRWLTVVWAVLQLVLPLAALHADAGQAARGADGRAHVEDATSAGCAATHASHCAICKQLSSLSLAPAAAALGLPDGRIADAMPASPAGSASARGRATLARAPPAHS
jgi:hypothetical protein